MTSTLKAIIFQAILSMLLVLPVDASVRIETLRGVEIAPYIQEIAKLCHQMYREYPYLYDGQSEDYEAYLESYAHSDEAVICLAIDNDKPIGLAAGIPMLKTRQAYKVPLIASRYQLAHLFYLGEFVLIPEYREQGYEDKIYQQFESYVRSQGGYFAICMWEIDEVCNPAPKPIDYVSNHDVWERMGFKIHPELDFLLSWKNINDSEETKHLAIYWMKSF